MLTTIFSIISIVNFDLYILSHSWIPGFCEFNSQGLCQNISVANTFSLHGLWPTWKNGSWPQYCSQDILTNNSIYTILPDLDTHWSDSGHDNWKLWSHEWSKHGTCSVGNPFVEGSLDYFSAGIWLDMRLNINGILSKSVITPSNISSYSKEELVKVLEGGLVCQRKNDRSILTEVRRVISLDFKKIYAMADDGSCESSIYLMTV